MPPIRVALTLASASMTASWACSSSMRSSALKAGGRGGRLQALQLDPGALDAPHQVGRVATLAAAPLVEVGQRLFGLAQRVGERPHRDRVEDLGGDRGGPLGAVQGLADRVEVDGVHLDQLGLETVPLDLEVLDRLGDDGLGDRGVIGPSELGGGLLERGRGEGVEVGPSLLDRLDGLEAGLLELDAAPLQGRDPVRQDVMAQAQPFELITRLQGARQGRQAIGGLAVDGQVPGADDHVHRVPHPEQAQVLPMQVQNHPVGLDQPLPAGVGPRGQGAERVEETLTTVVVQAPDDGDLRVEGQGRPTGRPRQLHEPHPSFIGRCRPR